MNRLPLGFRPIDVACREATILSWLAFRPGMPAADISSLFTDGCNPNYVLPVKVLNDLALGNLLKKELIQRTSVESADPSPLPIPRSYSVYNLAEGQVGTYDPALVELTPRQRVLMGLFNLPGYARTEAEITTSLPWLEADSDPEQWRTSACLGHLAALGLITQGQDGHYQQSPVPSQN